MQARKSSSARTAVFGTLGLHMEFPESFDHAFSFSGPAIGRQLVRIVTEHEGAEARRNPLLLDTIPMANIADMKRKIPKL